MSQDKLFFHFTLGPVQSFVAQARRTRDFWAGSFLLSWLSAVAIRAVQHQNGKVVFPIPDEQFLNAVSGKPVDNFPQQGGIPNRFMADITNCNNFDAKAVTNAVQQAWEAVCDAVWENDKQVLIQEGYPLTRQIWNRQVSGFWDMNWVITEGTDTSGLDKRKNLRTHVPSVEDGYKCMMMEGYQELSGAEGNNSGSKRRNYWLNIATSNKLGLDLKEGEQLSAIAFVKRRFVHTFDTVKVDILIDTNILSIQGWKLPKNVPSVGYMAAVPWLNQVLKSDGYSRDNNTIDNNVLAQLVVFNGDVEEVNNKNSSIGVVSERKNHVYSIKKAINQLPDIDIKDISLDGQLYYTSYWDNYNNLYIDKNHKTKEIKIASDKAIHSLKKLYDLVGQLPSPYYAILLMDGDSLGKQMGHEKRQPIISHALNKFTQNVTKIVSQHDGFLVYAGGDDVLALFSLDDALPAAVALQQNYKECFAQASQEDKGDEIVYSTLSGAINYCHMGNPLTQVLSDSHDLLDNVAKDSTGRDSLAIRVWKPSGLATEWTQPWDIVIDKSIINDLNQSFGLNLSENTAVISALAEVMAHQKTDDKNISVFSSSFFYKTRELMAKINDMQNANMINSQQITKLLLTEYYQSGQFGKMTNAQRQKLTDAFGILVEQSKQYRNIIVDGQSSIDPQSGKYLSGEAGILLRLLGQKGLSKGDNT